VDHAQRRSRLVERFGEIDAPAFLVTRLPNVRYLTGFTGSNGQLILAPDSDGGIFFTDGRYEEQSRHEVPDLRRQIYMGEFAPQFHWAVEELGLRRVGFESAGLTYRAYLALTGAGVELVPADDEVERLRWVKDAEELELIRAAQEVTDRTFELACHTLAVGITEKQAAFEMDTFMRKEGDGLAFDTIVAFGENGAEPHHDPTDRSLRRGELVKMDFGAVVGGYHSDMTRTVAFGEPAPLMSEIYEIVRRAQQAGVDAVRAGAVGKEVDRVTRDIIAGAGYGPTFKHGLGHGVGLEIHEGPSLRMTSDDVLAEGAVVTVEPGIYLAGVGGVRIEDMVEVTADGSRVIPRTPKELVTL
jgi:Xaa-Pro aminopeptidase